MRTAGTVFLTALTIIMAVLYTVLVNENNILSLSIALGALWFYTLIRWIVFILLVDAVKKPCSKEWLISVMFAEYKLSDILTPVLFIVLNITLMLSLTQLISRIMFIISTLIQVKVLLLKTRHIKYEYTVMKHILT